MLTRDVRLGSARSSGGAARYERANGAGTAQCRIIPSRCHFARRKPVRHLLGSTRNHAKAHQLWNCFAPCIVNGTVCERSSPKAPLDWEFVSAFEGPRILRCSIQTLAAPKAVEMRTLRHIRPENGPVLDSGDGGDDRRDCVESLRIQQRGQGFER